MSDLKPHHCHRGGMDINPPSHVSIVAGDGRAAIMFEFQLSYFTGQKADKEKTVASGAPINTCPFCAEPLSATGVKLDRIKRMEGLK